MTAQEIKSLVIIRNEEINNEIKNIKELYNIEVTDELLEQLVQFSLNAINYYNEKYNSFGQNKYESLFLFCDDFYNAIRYNYNLLISANYRNENYTKFANTLNNINTISALYNIIQMQIIATTQKENYIRKKVEVNTLKINKSEILNLDLPFHEKTLLSIYLYLNKTNDIKEIKKTIENKMELIKIGSCEIFEEIFFNFAKSYEKTNMKSEFYLEILEQNDENYNYELHKNALDILKGMI